MVRLIVLFLIIAIAAAIFGSGAPLDSRLYRKA